MSHSILQLGGLCAEPGRGCAERYGGHVPPPSPLGHTAAGAGCSELFGRRLACDGVSQYWIPFLPAHAPLCTNRFLRGGGPANVHCPRRATRPHIPALLGNLIDLAAPTLDGESQSLRHCCATATATPGWRRIAVEYSLIGLHCTVRC